MHATRVLIATRCRPGILALQPWHHKHCLRLSRHAPSGKLNTRRCHGCLQLTGTLPSWLGTMNVTQLEVEENEVESPSCAACLTHCRCQPSAPAQINSTTRLSSLDASWLQMSGSIPAEIGDMRNLNTLKLSDNMFSGPLPANLR